MKCTICGQEAVWVKNKEVYGRNFGKSWMIWLCRPCDAYVGCHQNTKRPKGTFADKTTRMARQAAHSVIDPFWRSGKYTRKEVYRRLSDVFGYEVHIGEANPKICEQIIAAANTLF